MALATHVALAAAEAGWIPDSWLRWGVRRLCRERLGDLETLAAELGEAGELGARDAARAARAGEPGALELAAEGGDLRGAGRHYRAVLEREPQHPDALHLLGMLLHRLGRTDIMLPKHHHVMLGG